MLGRLDTAISHPNDSDINFEKWRAPASASVCAKHTAWMGPLAPDLLTCTGKGSSHASSSFKFAITLLAVLAAEVEIQCWLGWPSACSRRQAWMFDQR